MTSPDRDLEPLLDALRSDLPGPKEADRLRARLTAAGIIAGGIVAAPSAASGAQGLATLGGAGLERCGATLAGLAATLGADPGEPAVRAWVDAWIRLSVTAESR